MKFCPADKNMANGMRDNRRTLLTEVEIGRILAEIRRIEADEFIFIFNDPDYVKDSTCYNFIVDRVYVTRNVLPDVNYISTHPRDTMSIAAVLAHEYYGHRPNRQEYLDDWKRGPDFHTTPVWEDECRASLHAAQKAPGLTDTERKDLVMDAVYRAKEYGQIIEMTEFMKEAVYGYGTSDKYILREFQYPVYISEESQEGT